MYNRNRILGTPLFLTISKEDVDRDLSQIIGIVYKEASELGDTAEIAKCFYKLQSFRELGETTDQCKIGVFVKIKQSSIYNQYIRNAINDINIAAPGLNLYITEDSEVAKIRICDNDENRCSTVDTFKVKTGACISLGHTVLDECKEQATIHELLHALGFQHEFKRIDAEKSVHIFTDDYQFKDKNDLEKLRGLTRFDPYSVMMYPESILMRRKRDGDTVWRLKHGRSLNIELSELDKVALNMVFRPCKGTDYNPEVGITGMFYCGRSVMIGNQQNTPTNTDGRCGPNNWANCPACRVLTQKKENKLEKGDKWQGWSGLIYCGRTFTEPKECVKAGKHLVHDGVCGPNNGLPCNDCGRLLYPNYDYSKEVE